jgi:PST family polysaccharide transporter
MLRKELGFERVAGIDLLKALIKTGGALALARLGAGVWALVAEDALEILVLVAAVWCVRPLRLRWVWDRALMRSYLAYGLPLCAAQLIAFLLMQFDDFWVGTRLGDAPLGFYAIAYGFAEYPRRVVSDPIQQVILATLARVQSDRLRLSQTFYRSSAYLVRVGLWAGGVFALVAREFVRTFIGDKWLPAVPAFRLLVLFATSLPLLAVALNLLVATGQAGLVLRVRTVQLVVFLPAVVIGVRLWGILGAALAEDLMVLAGLVILLGLARRSVDFSLARLVGRPLAALGVSVGLAWVIAPRLGIVSDWGQMVAKGALATLGYGVALLLIERRECGLALAWGLRALRRQPEGE